MVRADFLAREVIVMRRAKAESIVRIDPDYIFYVCLALVLAIAAIGIATDILNGR